MKSFKLICHSAAAFSIFLASTASMAQFGVCRSDTPTSNDSCLRALQAAENQCRNSGIQVATQTGVQYLTTDRVTVKCEGYGANGACISQVYWCESKFKDSRGNIHRMENRAYATGVRG